MLLPMELGAQQRTGSWEVFPTYAVPKKVQDTPEMVYVLMGSSLNGYDKTTDEIVTFNSTYRLNGNRVSNFWYNPDKHFLFVVHTDKNIDIVYDDGRTVNIAEVANSSVTIGTINDVAFDGSLAYLALSNGMMVIDTDYGVILEAALFGENLTRIVVKAGKILALKSGEGNIYVASTSGAHNDFSSFSKTGVIIKASGSMEPLNGNKVLACGISASSTKMCTIEIDPTAPNATCLTRTELDYWAYAESIMPTKEGYSIAEQTVIRYIDKDAKVLKMVYHNIPDYWGTQAFLSNWNGSTDPNPEIFWMGRCWTVYDYGKWDGASKGYIYGPLLPEGTTGSNVGMIKTTNDGRVYMTTLSRSNRVATSADGAKGYADAIIDGKLTALTSMYTLYDWAINPKNQDEIVISTRSELIRYNVKTKESTSYKHSNSTITNGWEANPVTLLIYSVCFDKDGNLWVTQNNGNSATKFLHFVAADDWNNGAPKSAWNRITLPIDLEYWHSTRMTYVPHGGGYILIAGKNTLTCYSLNGTPGNLSDDDVKVITWSYDTDGMSIGGYGVSSYAIGKDGRLWIGYDAGVMYYDDLSKIFTLSPEPTRPKVARDDGTNLADFLLSNVDVMDIRVDENGQLWIATNGSGLYRVSSDGTEILDHFTTENSSIPSDNIYTVSPDPQSNKVYVGSDIGLAVYHSTSAPASENYDEVYAYPNPVTPDYTGYITIAGLMNNSLVKIADAAGRVFFSGKSDGGSVVWDGTDASGNRVKSGVYFVFASQNENGSSAVVTKIVVVN